MVILYFVYVGINGLYFRSLIEINWSTIISARKKNMGLIII